MDAVTTGGTDVLQAIGWILSSGWTFLQSVTVPGFGFSFATLFVGLFLASLGLRFLSMILGVSFGAADLNRAEQAGVLKRKNTPNNGG